MKRLFSVLSVVPLALILMVPAAAQSPSVAGEWDVVLNTPGGPRNMKATFKVDGEKLTGELKRENAPAPTPLQGTFKGKEIKFSYTVRYNDNDLLITMFGNVEGDAIKGTADFNGVAQDEWSAKRASGATVTASNAAPASAQSAGVTGDWELTINSPQGSRTAKASLKQDGEKLTGAFKGPSGELPIQGTVKGKEVKLTYTVKFQDQDLPITMTGQVDGDAMKGDADFGGFAQGDWSGKRAGASAATASNAAPSSSSEKIDVTGAWNIEVETSAGSGNPSFNLKQDGEKLSGKYKGLLGEFDVTGSLKGNQIEFSFKATGQVDGTVVYTGTTDGKTMKGKVSLAGLGEGTFTGKKQ
jgi:hypothetical protein